MPGLSRSSAGATYLDKEGRIGELRRVILFGSLARGIPTPRSDADIPAIVESSPHTEPRDRIPGVLEALSSLPCPVDLFVLTSEEAARLKAEGSSFLEMIQATGIDLLPSEAEP